MYLLPPVKGMECCAKTTSCPFVNDSTDNTDCLQSTAQLLTSISAVPYKSGVTRPEENRRFKFSFSRRPEKVAEGPESGSTPKKRMVAPWMAYCLGYKTWQDCKTAGRHRFCKKINRFHWFCIINSCNPIGRPNFFRCVLKQKNVPIIGHLCTLWDPWTFFFVFALLAFYLILPDFPEGGGDVAPATQMPPGKAMFLWPTRKFPPKPRSCSIIIMRMCEMTSCTEWNHSLFLEGHCHAHVTVETIGDLQLKVPTSLHLCWSNSFNYLSDWPETSRKIEVFDFTCCIYVPG